MHSNQGFGIEDTGPNFFSHWDAEAGYGGEDASTYHDEANPSNQPPGTRGSS
ncbi:hypothetical protein COLO4_37713 [Corchorus olitorius]|uniref:Uncharacterized protein n=1 Tax=Corchorus olitorius TaxID=93759 RepID=A0A1R3FZY8_9ROSI|nr:hypothetical protein COLO4_37713 [Corchorus olitorius]